MTAIPQGRGDFSDLAEDYDKGRKGCPPWVFDRLKSNLPAAGKWNILDAACGTGISARQVDAEIECTVTGVDRDPEMLKVAKAKQGRNPITYLCTEFVDLQLPPRSFDAVTIFSAFHWFADDTAAVNALVKLLKPGGCILVANRNVLVEVASDYRKLIDAWSGKEVPDVKKDYYPAAALSRAGLSVVSEKKLELERYTISEALHLLCSKSLWNDVPKDLRPLGKRVLKAKLKQRANQHGSIRRDVRVSIHIGKVPE